MIQTNKNIWELFQEHSIKAFKRNKKQKSKRNNPNTRIKNGKIKKFNIPSRTRKCIVPDKHVIRHKNSMLQPKADHKYIHETTDKTNVQHFL